MGEEPVVSQYSALASMVFMMAFTMVFDGVISRHRYRDRRLGLLLREYCLRSAL